MGLHCLPWKLMHHGVWEKVQGRLFTHPILPYLSRSQAQIFSWIFGLCGISKVLQTATRSRAMLTTSPVWRILLGLSYLSDNTISENTWINDKLELTKADWVFKAASRGLPFQSFTWAFPLAAWKVHIGQRVQKNSQEWVLKSKSHQAWVVWT